MDLRLLGKLISLVLAVAMVLGMMSVAFAAKTVDVGTGEGSITLANGTTGEKYQLYKIFDATYSGTNVAYTFTKTEENAAFYTALTGTDSPFDLTETATENVYQVTRKTTQTDDDALLSWVETQVKDKAYLKIGDEITLAEADQQKIVWDNLAYGYYLITTTLGDKAVTIDSNIPDVEVIDKNQVPEFDKNIILTEDDPTTEENEQELAKINATGISLDVPFDITVKSKNYEKEEKVYQYIIYDTLDDGFTLKAAPVVKIAGTTKTVTTDYTINYYTDSTKTTAAKTDLSDCQYFEITIPWTDDGTVDGDHLYLANDEINVTYTCFLDPEKFEDIKFGANPNLNTADVKYNKGDDEPNEPSGDLPDKTTKTYETSLTIHKVDGDEEPLAGAEFTLTSENGTKYTVIVGQKFEKDNENGTYYLLTDGKYTEEAPNGNATHDAAYATPTTDKYKLVDFTDVVGDSTGTTELKAFVKADGTLTFKGLFPGDYTLTETVVPAGYNKAADIEFTITFDADTEKFASDNVNLEETNNVFDTTVINREGTELPSTGGIGTTIFYLVGAALVLGAGVLLVTKRKMVVNK